MKEHIAIYFASATPPSLNNHPPLPLPVFRVSRYICNPPTIFLAIANRLLTFAASIARCCVCVCVYVLASSIPFAFQTARLSYSICMYGRLVVDFILFFFVSLCAVIY